MLLLPREGSTRQVVGGGDGTRVAAAPPLQPAMPTRAHCSLLVALCALAYAAVGSGVGRAAVIVRGESFRANSRQGSRETGEAGVEPQKAAVRSQLEQLVLPLLFRGFGVDVYLETYLTPWAEQLQAWYGPFLRHRRTLVSAAPLLPPLESSFLREVLQRGEHSLLVLLRPDAWLKHTFGCAVAAANLSAILFAFREWRRWPEKDGWTRVADNFVFVPGWAFPQVRRMGGVKGGVVASTAVSRRSVLLTSSLTGCILVADTPSGRLVLCPAAPRQRQLHPPGAPRGHRRGAATLRGALRGFSAATGPPRQVCCRVSCDG